MRTSLLRLLLPLTVCGALPAAGTQPCPVNGSFEEPVMPPAWIFVADDGLDERGMRLVSSTAHLHRVHDESAPDGAFFLAFRGIGPATLESAPFRYCGGAVEVCGWSSGCGLASLLQTAPGIVELVGRDSSGAVVQVQTMLEQPSGDSPWRPFSAQTAFPETVATLTLRLRTMMTVRGEFHLDGLAVRHIDGNRKEIFK